MPFIITREDWDLLQAVKEAGLTLDSIEALNDPAPLPLDGEYWGRTKLEVV